jgi:hypothetical protein
MGRAWRGREEYLHSFLFLAIDDNQWPASRSGRYSSFDIAPVSHWLWVERTVSPQAGLTTLKKVKTP